MTRPLLAISNHGFMLGGGEYAFFDLLAGLPPPWVPIAVLPQAGELSLRLRQRRIETRVVPLSPLRPWRGPQVLGTLNGLLRACRQYRPCLLYANGSRAMLYAGVAGKLTRTPVLWHCRIAQRDPYLDVLLGGLARRIVANSRATAQRFPLPLHAKIRVVYNGLDIDWLREDGVQPPGSMTDASRVMVAVARASREKRHDLLLAAFEEVAAAEGDVRLVCIGSPDPGDPQWWEELQARTRQSAFAGRIHWPGQATDVRPWYRRADLLVLGSENEAFGRVLVEAMACGVPVVAVKSGGVGEIVRHGRDGLLVPPGRPGEMAAAVLRILRDSALRARLSRSARTRAEGFSLDAHVAGMIRVFEETANLGTP